MRYDLLKVLIYNINKVVNQTVIQTVRIVTSSSGGGTPPGGENPPGGNEPAPIAGLTGIQSLSIAGITIAILLPIAAITLALRKPRKRRGRNRSRKKMKR